LNWAIAYSTPYLVNYGDGYANLQSKIFFIWFAACFLCIGFVYFFIYETKGLSLEEVDEMYGDCGKARKSPQWTPKVSFQQRASVSGQGGIDGRDKGSHEAGNSVGEGTVEKREHAAGERLQ
jgi:MFS transporter, SP family, sugar:H+ symporter